MTFYDTSALLLLSAAGASCRHTTRLSRVWTAIHLGRHWWIAIHFARCACRAWREEHTEDRRRAFWPTSCIGTFGIVVD